MKLERWQLFAIAFLGLQLAFVISLAVYLGFNQPPPFEKYANAAFAVVAFVGGVTMAWRIRHRPARPLQFLIASDWSHYARFVSAMALVWLQFVTLTWAKAMIPLASGGMWADPALADFEAGLIGGDAWRLLPAPNMVLDVIYSVWAPTIGAVFAWQFYRKGPNRQTNLLALFLTIGLLGTVGQYLLPSGGPIFFERLGFGDRFAAMPPSHNALVASDYLWAAYTGNYLSFATGISAFPSIHVATSAWVALSARNAWGYLYLAVIFAGSIILGWHYAIDGVAGALGALLCYRLANKLLVHPAPSFRKATA